MEVGKKRTLLSMLMNSGEQVTVTITNGEEPNVTVGRIMSMDFSGEKQLVTVDNETIDLSQGTAQVIINL